MAELDLQPIETGSSQPLDLQPMEPAGPKSVQQQISETEPGLFSSPALGLNLAGQGLQRVGGALEKAGGEQAEELGKAGVPDILSATTGGIAAVPGAITSAAGNVLSKVTPTDLKIQLALGLGEQAAKSGVAALLETPAGKAGVKAGLDAATKIGIKALPSFEAGASVAGSVLKFGETLMSRIPGGAAVIEQLENANKLALQKYKDLIVSGLSKVNDYEQFSKDIGGAIAAHNTAIEGRAKEMVASGEANAASLQSEMETQKLQKAQLARQAATSEFKGEGSTGWQAKLARQKQMDIDKLHEAARWDQARSSIPPQLNSEQGAPLAKSASGVMAEAKEAGLTNSPVFKAAAQAAKGPSSELVDAKIKASMTAMGIAPGDFENYSGLQAKLRAQLGGQSGYTFENLHQMQSKWAQMAEATRGIDGRLSNEGRLFYKLHDGAIASLDGMFDRIGGDAQKNYQIAKTFTYNTRELAGKLPVRTLLKDDSDLVLGKVVKAGDRTGTGMVVRAMGDKRPVQQYLTEEIFGRAGDPIPSRAEVFKNLAKYRDNMAAVFSPEQMANLEKSASGMELSDIEKSGYEKRIKEGMDAANKRATELKTEALIPENILHSVMHGDTGSVVALRKIATPAQMEQARSAFVMSRFANADTAAKGLPAIKQSFNKLPDEFKKALFPPGMLESINNIGTAEELLPGFADLKRPIGVKKAAVGGMAATLGAAGMIIYLRPKPATLIGLSVAPFAMTSLMLSPTGRKIISTLLQTTPEDIRAVGLAAKLGQLGYISQRQVQGEGQQ